MIRIKETIVLVFFMLLIPNISNAQSKKQKQKLTITGVTGNSIKEALELDESQKIINEITKQLVKDNIVKREKGLSYMLNSEEFIVNGKNQPENIHKKYMDKYIKDREEWNICKNYKI